MRLRPANEITWANYRWAYGECSRWLAGWFAPWRWVVGFVDVCRDLRLHGAVDVRYNRS